jgi:hypothetical protein
VVALVVGATYGALELGQRYLGLQKLVIEQVNVTGCRGQRLDEIQRVANKLCLGKPLFWLDVERLRQTVEQRRWVKGLLIRKDPPDRLSLVIEERKPLLWLARPTWVYLLSDDGIVLDRVHQGNLMPIPVVANPKSQTDKAIVQLIRAATSLRDRQKEFYERLTEMRMSDKGPVVFLEGVPAPILLSKYDATKNIPNFQMLFLNEISKRPDLAQIRYFDLRWDDEVALGEPKETEPPKVKNENR